MMTLALMAIGYSVIHATFIVFSGGVLRTFIHTYAMLIAIAMWPVVFVNTALDRIHIESWATILIFLVSLELFVKGAFTKKKIYWFASLLASAAIWLLL